MAKDKKIILVDNNNKTQYPTIQPVQETYVDIKVKEYLVEFKRRQEESLSLWFSITHDQIMSHSKIIGLIS